jgi:hypothetical protein
MFTSAVQVYSSLAQGGGREEAPSPAAVYTTLKWKMEDGNGRNEVKIEAAFA